VQQSLFKTGGLTLISRLAGIARGILLATILKAGPAADAFMLAFRPPNHFREIRAEGAFGAAFMPTYSALEQRDGPEPALHFHSAALALVVLANLALLAGALGATGSEL
jgi:putative peptidoglycan lipid II flippase